MTDTLIPENDAAAPADAKGKKGKKDKKEKGGKSNLVPAIVLALGILGGGYFMGQGGEGTAAAGPTTTEAPVLGEIATVEPININLKDGHFLRVGMALQLIVRVRRLLGACGEQAHDGSDMEQCVPHDQILSKRERVPGWRRPAPITSFFTPSTSAIVGTTSVTMPTGAVSPPIERFAGTLGPAIMPNTRMALASL